MLGIPGITLRICEAMIKPEMTSKDFASNVWEYLIKFSIKQSHRLTESDKYRLSFEKVEPREYFEMDISFAGRCVMVLVFEQKWFLYRLEGNVKYDSDSPVMISEEILNTLERICQDASQKV